ncbi:hypothetical protein GYMLUDRAFT_75655 [Collybiopsis luxurians FD-317 M1]|uniref:Aminoglycoside phosphotransferase domain-containing protein n=1 Tax=Collybiopsis luxurians FD-317 M1 TaxID=944289 RepID=A0A0D0CGZ0_9AGAR|nr:hypothetical protein GYMLUDRAFT_75655 [Collybiopsis luxurians FD-317 M1]
MTVSLEEAQKAISKAFPDYHVDGYTPTHKTYIIQLSLSSQSPSTHTSFITVSIPPDRSSPYHPNSLQVFHQLITLIHDQTSIPIPEPILDVSLNVISHPYLVTPPYPVQSQSIVPLSLARSQHLLTPQQEAFVDLSIGQLLGQLHSRVQNDWFGRPSTSQPADASYSWQETFISLLEPLLEHAQAAQIDLGASYQDVHQYLSRAIAFFLFDDVQVPSLIWFTGSEDDIYISRPSPSDTSPTVQIAAILPTVAHSLWGDPLLETFFLPPAPSEAVREGYLGGGGEPLLVFARQKTKRLWYTVFLALVVLIGRGEEMQGDEKKTWALEALRRSTEALKDAPCY